MTRLESVRRMFEATIDSSGGLDILVANAGGNYDHSRVEDGHPADWLATLQLNLVGAYYCARSTIPYLRRRASGKIIMIGSGMGHHGHPGSSAYACAKVVLRMLTRILAQELWQYNISVNELVPGPVMTGRMQKTQAEVEDTVFSIKSEWIKDTQDVAPLALFLANQPDKGPTAQSFSLMRRDR